MNIFIGLDLIKHIREYTDEVLLDEYAFNYQISFALGLRTLGERYFALILHPERFMNSDLGFIIIRSNTQMRQTSSSHSLKSLRITSSKPPDLVLVRDEWIQLRSCPTLSWVGDYPLQ